MANQVVQAARLPAPKSPKHVRRMHNRADETAHSGTSFAQRSPELPAGDGSFTAGANVTRRVQQLNGRGAPLPKSVRRELEPQFQADFSAVRIHTGPDAVQLSRELNAQAFTHGTNIAFGAGRFNPNTVAGKHLLAHELTHTIQQTGRVQLRRVDAAVIPRAGDEKPRVFRSWLKNIFSKKGKNEGPVLPEKYTDLTSDEKQMLAESYVTDALSIANTAVERAKTVHDDLLYNRLYDSQEDYDDIRTSSDKTYFGGAKHKSGRRTARRLQRSNQKVIFSKTNPIVQFRDQIQAIEQEVNAGKDLNLRYSDSVSTNNLLKALQAKDLAQQAQDQANALDTDSLESQVHARRSGLKQPKDQTLAGAEKSASDAVMNIFDLKNKASGYYDYAAMDEKTLQGHLSSKMMELAEIRTLGLDGVQMIVAAGYQRSKAGIVAPLSDTAAYLLRMGLSGNLEIPDVSDDVSQDQMPVELGKTIGQMNTDSGDSVLQDKISGKPKKKPKNSGEALTKEVKYLELRAMLHGKAQQRLDQMQDQRNQVDTLYNEAYQAYGRLDVMKKAGAGKIDEAVKIASEAHLKHGRANAVVEKMRLTKQEIYAESQKFEKYVGERAMSKTKRRAKQLAGMIGGAALKVFTGGLYRFEAEQRGGGYRTALKSKTLLEDIARKVAELKILVKGLDGHGMNKHAMRSFVFFKGLSFAIEVIRNIAGAIALWLGLTVVGSPVGAAFATIAFYCAAAKLAIDTMLLIQASVARAKTNDPLSRILLSGQQSSLAAEIGSSAGALGGAGITMGVSGNTGIATGQVQQSAFGVDPKLGQNSQFSNLRGLDYKIGNMVEVRKVADQVGLGATIMGVVPGVATSDESHKALGVEHTEEGNRWRSARKGAKRVFHPFNSAIKKLHRFTNKSKKSKMAQMAKLGSEISQTVNVLETKVDQQDGDENGVDT